MLRQFIGRRIGPILWQDMTSVIDFWFKNTILPMEYTIDAYQITINETNNPVEIQRQNRVKVLVEVRYQRAVRYIDVYNTALKKSEPITFDRKLSKLLEERIFISSSQKESNDCSRKVS